MALFTGTRDRRIDAKDRVVIPAPIANVIQAESGGTLYLVPADGLRCLEAYPARKFEAMATNHAPDRFAGDQQKRRQFFHLAEEVEIKGPGRITIPVKAWIETYFPQGVVRVAGMADYLELWDPAEWERVFGGGAAPAAETPGSSPGDPSRAG